MASLWGDPVLLSEDYEAGTETYSAREYLLYEIQGVRVDYPDGYRPDRRLVNVKIYVDVLNGTIVGDVETYEASLGLEPEVRQVY